MREISWFKGAQKAFLRFPDAVRSEGMRALQVAAAGGFPETAKPLHGLGSGVTEIAIRHRGDAWRIVYVINIGRRLWVLHAFQKKSKSGIATPEHEIALVRERLARLRRLQNGG